LELAVFEATFLFSSCFSHVGFTQPSSDLVRSAVAVRSGFDSHSVLLLNQVFVFRAVQDLVSVLSFQYSLFFVLGSPV
jgi:hypothetical protein